MPDRLRAAIPPRLRRSAALFSEQQLADRAAALAYWSVLALFPGLALLVSILGLFGTERTVNGLLEVISELGPESTVDTLRTPIEQIANHRSGAVLATLASLAGTLWTASGYLGAFRRTAETIRGDEQMPSALVMRPLQLAITLGIVLAAALVLSALLLTGPLAEAVGGALGLGDLTLTVWSLAKWPALAAAAVAGITLLYWSGGRATKPRVGELLPGALLASGLWLAGSVLFELYVANFGSYNATYGSLGAAIIFIVWLWLTNAAILLGTVYNETR